MTTDSEVAPEAARTTRPGKRERLVAAARELMYHQGVARTTLAEIAAAADVPVGNVYYYFKTKEDIVGALVQAHRERLEDSLAELERRHRTPKARLTGLAGMLTGQRETVARYGCPYGTLSSELAKRDDGTDPLGSLLLQVQVGWAERQFEAMGRRDAHDLAVELVGRLQGATVLTSAFGDPEVMAQQARRLERWVDSLDA